MLILNKSAINVLNSEIENRSKKHNDDIIDIITDYNSQFFELKNKNQELNDDNKLKNILNKRLLTESKYLKKKDNKLEQLWRNSRKDLLTVTKEFDKFKK